jgi:hypothetical protein
VSTTWTVRVFCTAALPNLARSGGLLTVWFDPADVEGSMARVQAALAD